MKNLILICSLLSLFVLSACGSGGSGSGKTTHGIPDDEENSGGKTITNTVTINGKSPHHYYNQFLYRKSGTCRKGDLNFHYLVSYSIMLEAKPDGQPKIAAEIDIAITNDDTYYYKYEERDVVTSEGLNRYTFNVSHRDEGFGKYKISEDGKIVFDKWGIGSALTYNERDALLFQFTNEERTNLRDQEALMIFVQGNGGILPRERSFNDVCRR